jgi:predicted alpha-1,2-mannosidase
MPKHLINKAISLWALSLTVALQCLPTMAQKPSNVTYVNPMIGTGGHGHTFPGAVWPNGMVQLSPDTRIDNSWDGCSGYHYSDTFIYGFSHTHLSGTGIPDWCDVLIMPTNNPTERNSQQYKSTFQHKNEKASPGYYEVKLDKHNILAQLTVTPRVGIHKYTFAKGDTKYLLIDLLHRDEVLDSEFEIVYPNKIRGYRFSKSWAKMQKVYFDIEFSEPFTSIEFIDNDTINKHPYAHSKKLKALVQFATTSQSIGCKVAISAVDNMGAQNNLETEATHNSFDRYKSVATLAWKTKLDKLQVYGGSQKDKVNFYTALYHCYVHPSIYNDCDGRYLGMDKKIHSVPKGSSYYTVFSLWDTYRALHPLLTIIDSELTTQLCNTLLLQYEQQQKLAVWELSGNETNCMIGKHSISVLYDAWQKGYRNFNGKLALEAMVNTMQTSTPTQESFFKYGYVRGEDDFESVSKTLELSYNAWCVAQMSKDVLQIAKNSNDSILQEYCKDVNTRFNNAASNWQNVFDAASQHMRPIYNATFLKDFSPYIVDNNFTEANSWQYSFYVPQHIESLAQKMGGKQALLNKLDALFTAKTETEGRTQSDITGLIGQYAHGNEPSHHIAWLYSYLGKGMSADKYINKITQEFYTNAPDGLIGNEDCGQMSAWYVMSSMGIYPICPGNGTYATATPIWDSVMVNDGAKQFTIKKNTKANAYKAITHEQLTKQNSCTDVPSNIPIAKVENKIEVSANPVILDVVQIFTDSQKINMSCNSADAKIFYKLSNEDFKQYATPFFINKSTDISFYSENNYGKSMTQTAQFFKVPNNIKVDIAGKFHRQYHAGGPAGLIDGLRGKPSWQVGFWQGYQYQDFEATITLNDKQTISEVGAGFLSDQYSWIFFPTKLEVLTSTDGVNFESAGIQNIEVPRQDDTTIIKDVAIKLATPKQVKAIRYKAKNYGPLPDWHLGKGDEAFIFVDEVWWK